MEFSRREFLKATSAGVSLALVSGPASEAEAAPARPLLTLVTAACRRLAPLGWRRLLLDVSGGELDMTAADLRAALSRRLTRIDRSIPGFADFDREGVRGIEPGRPDRSLLYHALCAASVVSESNGAPLRGFPTLAEIEAIENFVYGVAPPTIEELRTAAAGRPLGLVVFALHYRNTQDSVHGRHAQLCFARTGISRLGTIEPLYDSRERRFTPIDPKRPFDFRVVPQRFAAYVAVKMRGGGDFGPQDSLAEDKDLEFWVPLHKLFNGPECIAGRTLQVDYRRHLQNEGVAQFHRFLDLNGLSNNWRGRDLEEFPFTIRNERIASLSRRAEFGAAVLEPRPAPLVTAARYKGAPLTFPVDPAYSGEAANLQVTSLMVLPETAVAEPSFLGDSGPNTQRPAPQYVHIRHRVMPNGRIENLNRRPDMEEVIRRGGYQAQHYIDFSGDGWIAARCPQIESALDAQLPAYCMVGLPDFFPAITQRDLMAWTNSVVPERLRQTIWAVPPVALSQIRIAANIHLEAGFSIKDTTVTAIVSQAGANPGAPVQPTNGAVVRGKVGLPDGSPGIFDPGWDTSQGIYFTDPGNKLEKYMVGYGLGSPFIEDAKLCAAMGSYWPGVAPDATRTFQPNKILSGIGYPWPSVVPLTDREIGSEPLPNGTFMPWDGVRGPSLRRVGDRRMAAYTDAMRADYIDLLGTMTGALTSRIDDAEYKARVLAMETVYWNLGIRPQAAPGAMSLQASQNPALDAEQRKRVTETLRRKAQWAVLSFRQVDAGDSDLARAEQGTRKLEGRRRYRFHVYRWGEQVPDPADLRTVLVEIKEEAFFYLDGSTTLVRRGDGAWSLGETLPT